MDKNVPRSADVFVRLPRNRAEIAQAAGHAMEDAIATRKLLVAWLFSPLIYLTFLHGDHPDTGLWLRAPPLILLQFLFGGR
jgi:hypothetical protein